MYCEYLIIIKSIEASITYIIVQTSEAVVIRLENTAKRGLARIGLLILTSNISIFNARVTSGPVSVVTATLLALYAHPPVTVTASLLNRVQICVASADQVVVKNTKKALIILLGTLVGLELCPGTVGVVR